MNTRLTCKSETAEQQAEKAKKTAEQKAEKAKKNAEQKTEKAKTPANIPGITTELKYKPRIINKGTGAGGANTNYYGKKFEEKTNNHQRLLDMGYIKNSFTKKNKKASDFYLSKTFENKTVVFVLQTGLKQYMKNKYNMELFRCPDEAYIIEYNCGRKVIKILEKKEQNVEGSVETKLWSGPSLKREYELVLGPEFEVFYGFCLNKFLKNKIVSTEKKYTILNTIFNETNIAVLFGEDDDYFETFDKWFNNSL